MEGGAIFGRVQSSPLASGELGASKDPSSINDRTREEGVSTLKASGTYRKIYAKTGTHLLYRPNVLSEQMP